MGLLSKLFGWKIVCPNCGAADAKDSFAGVCCRNSQCRNYDLRYAQSVGSAPAGYSQAAPAGYTERNPRTGVRKSLPETVHFPNPLIIEYMNAKDELKRFSCERESVRQRGIRISIRVEPTGRWISLAPGRIKNLAEVQQVMQMRQPDFSDSVEIVYQNFRGERKTFQGAGNTLRFGPNHVSVCVAPRGARISLKQDRILNWPTVQRRIHGTAENS